MQDQPAQQNQPGWTFSPGQQSPQAAQPVTQQTPAPVTPQHAASQQSQALQQSDSIVWSASEFMEHPKGAGWYLAFFAAAIVGIAAIYLLTRDIISVVVLGVFAIVFAVFAARKPRTLQYSLSEGGVKVGERFYQLGNFKSFSLIDEGVMRSISFFPLQRFMPPLTIYFAPEDEDRIASFLADQLPYEERKQDPVDNLMRKIRF